MLLHFLDARRTKWLLFNINMASPMVARNTAVHPSMNAMNPAGPPRLQAAKQQDTFMTYAKAARGLRHREQSAGTSPSQHQARQESQGGSRQNSNHVASIQQSTSTSPQEK
ncbi:hypothetical protein HPB52_012093 [Rhipicephalus sanguineus]|uniref:Uncharacterized protein n=1 Tax=Rhipicephalus sanguineus TaxID=34632 RepID=A0A9D4T9V0_RHISA|nr:hypothetical protein HPB52_012093 [Rhipicephalus sanguineus]